MCGLAGIWHRDGRPVSKAALQRMNDLQAHRGPDDEALWMDGEVGLAHRRLGIVDPSVAGRQPMGTPDGSLWITFNGEIHDHEELRAELAAAGVRFRSRSDTEVLLHAYRQWGVECFARLNGMWALALWHARRQELLLCRDRFGIKPLFVSERGPRLAFASEIKAILAAFPEEARPNEAEIHAFLCGASPDAGAATFFAGVSALPPATWRLLSRDGRSREGRYWSLPEEPPAPRADAPEAFRHLLTDAVRLRLRSDAPLGALLSGGLDSSSVVRIAAPQVRELPCFSLRNADPAYDESGFAAIAARGLPSARIHWVEAGPEDMVETISRIVWHHDAPNATRGRYPHWCTLREAGRHVKVVLEGQGADELLAGYRRFRLPHLLDRARELRRGGRAWPELRAALPGVGAAELLPALARRARLPIWPAPRLLSRAFARRQGPLEPSAFQRAWLSPRVPRPFASHLANALYGEVFASGLPELLHEGDALGMAFSVESRPVFLDHRLVELCFALPSDEKLRGGWSKSLLRRAMEGVLPPEIQERRDKKGFPAPIDDWLRRPANLRAIDDLLLAPGARSAAYLDRRALAGLLGRWRRDPRSVALYGRELVWRCLTLELWLRLFLDGARPAAPPAAA